LHLKATYKKVEYKEAILEVEVRKTKGKKDGGYRFGAPIIKKGVSQDQAAQGNGNSE